MELYGNGNDGDDVTMGSVIFGDNSNTTGANSLICSIQGETVGTNATNGGGKLHFQTKPDNGSLAIAMTILGSGNVGIGNGNPSFLLDLGDGSSRLYRFRNGLSLVEAWI